jgi:hypothetical protein
MSDCRCRLVYGLQISKRELFMINFKGLVMSHKLPHGGQGLERLKNGLDATIVQKF